MNESNFSCYVARGNQPISPVISKRTNPNNLSKDMKLLFVKSNFKLDLTAMLQPIILGTPFDTYDICEKITNNIDNQLLYDKDNMLLVTDIITNEILRIAIQCSTFTGKEYIEYISSRKVDIETMVRKIYVI